VFACAFLYVCVMCCLLGIINGDVDDDDDDDDDYLCYPAVCVQDKIRYLL